MTRTLFLTCAALTTLVAGAAFAESAPADETHQKAHPLRDNRQEIIGDRKALHEDRQELRDARREGNADAVAAEKAEIKQGREELRDDMRVRHEERKELHEQRKDKRQQMREKRKERSDRHREMRRDRPASVNADAPRGKPMEMPERPQPEVAKEYPRPATVIKGAPVSTDAPAADDAAAH